MKLRKSPKDSKQKETPRITLSEQTKEGRVAFSFAHITTNKHYSFSFFKDDLRKDLETRKGFDELLQTLSRSTWEEVLQRRREAFGGYETIPRSSIHFQPSWNLAEDNKVCVFRFRNSDCRMLGIKAKHDNVLYIIGFDFDFTAYDHG